MTLYSLELLIIVGAIILFSVWGPSKIPELAKALGRASGEFKKTSREARGEPPKLATKQDSGDPPPRRARK